MQPNKKIISFALWGTNPLYVDGAVWNAEHAKDFYPGWVCRFYHDETVPLPALEKIKATGAELVQMGITTDVLGMFWRFNPMFDDPTIARFIVRDTDSKFCDREVEMVNEWIASGKPFHVIRDCESHATPILGGTWGAIPGCVPDLELKMGFWFSQIHPDYNNPRGLYHGSDQIFLTRFAWPVIKDNHIAHVRANMPHLKYMGNEIEVANPIDGHYIGMVC
jgi:hypothetical protein